MLKAVVGPAALVAALLSAQGLPVVAAEEITQVVVSGDRLALDAAQLPYTLDSVDSRNSQHIAEALQQLPGVGFHRNNGQESLPALRSPVLSGAGACGALLTAENGVPLRPAGFCNVNELFESHFEAALQVQALKGPQLAGFGSNALLGVVNVVLPELQQVKPALSLSWADDDYYQLALQQRFGNTAVAFTGTRYNDYREDAWYDQQKLSLVNELRGDHGTYTTRFTATNLNQETAGFIVGQDAYRSWTLSEQNLNPEAYRDARALRLSSQWQFNNLLTVTPYARYSRMDFLQHFLPGTPLEQNGHYSVGVQSQYPLLVTEHQRLQLGIDAEYADIWLRESQDQPTLGSAFLQATIPVGKHYDYQVDSTQVALFADYQLDLRYNITLNIGGRWEQVRYRYDNKMNDGRVTEAGLPCGFGGCRFNRPPDRHDSYSHFSPKMGLSWQVAEELQLYANIAEGYRVPQATELYRLQRDQGVAELGPESALSREVGFRLVQPLALSLAWYRVTHRDQIIRNSDFFNINGARTRYQGLELTATIELLPDLHWHLAAAFEHHQYLNNPGLSSDDIVGNDIDTAPRERFYSALRYRWGETTELALSWQKEGGYFTDIENSNRYSGHQLWQVRTSHTISDRLSLRFTVDNLLNERYAERADYTSFSGPRYLPGTPRTIGVSLQYAWR